MVGLRANDAVDTGQAHGARNGKLLAARARPNRWPCTANLSSYT